MNINKTLYGIIGVVILAVVLFFVGRLSAPVPPVEQSQKYIAIQRAADSLALVTTIEKDSLIGLLSDKENAEVVEDDMKIDYKKRYNKKSHDYEKLLVRYNNLTDDSLNLVITTRLDSSIKARLRNTND